MLHPAQDPVASACGWTSFVLWTLAAYPQPWLNWTRGSTRGLSFDFVGFSLLAHINYLVFTASLYLAQTDKETGSHDGVVGLNDVLFPLHAAMIGLFLVWQCWYYEHPTGPSEKLKQAVCFELLVLCIAIGFVQLSWFPWVDVHHANGGFGAVYIFGALKVAAVCVKYPQQVLENEMRKSTDGLSFTFVFLDFAGATLYLGQSLLNGWAFGEAQYVSGNIPKIVTCSVAILSHVAMFHQYFRFAKNASCHNPLVQGVHDSVGPYSKA